jgi:hypothetical protein
MICSGGVGAENQRLLRRVLQLVVLPRRLSGARAGVEDDAGDDELDDGLHVFVGRPFRAA